MDSTTLIILLGVAAILLATVYVARNMRKVAGKTDPTINPQADTAVAIDSGMYGASGSRKSHQDGWSSEGGGDAGGGDGGGGGGGD